jgi:hypothetical protein
MPQFVLIIGEDPDLIDFSAPDVPPNMDAPQGHGRPKRLARPAEGLRP